jgi:hypothetical protein
MCWAMISRWCGPDGSADNEQASNGMRLRDGSCLHGKSNLDFNALYQLGHDVEVRASAAPVVLTADGLEWRFIAAEHGLRALGKARGCVADHMIVAGSVETCSDEWEALAATLGGRR